MLTNEQIASFGDSKIIIVSGEGEKGTSEIYKGKRTSHALQCRLSKERCDEDRWAKAIVYSHTNDYGAVGVDLETGESCTF